jgi:hypothetical protein
LDHKDPKDHKEKSDPKDHRAKLDHKDLREISDHKDLRDLREISDHKDLREQQVKTAVSIIIKPGPIYKVAIPVVAISYGTMPHKHQPQH